MLGERRSDKCAKSADGRDGDRPEAGDAKSHMIIPLPDDHYHCVLPAVNSLPHACVNYNNRKRLHDIFSSQRCFVFSMKAPVIARFMNTGVLFLSS